MLPCRWPAASGPDAGEGPFWQIRAAVQQAEEAALCEMLGFVASSVLFA